MSLKRFNWHWRYITGMCIFIEFWLGCIMDTRKYYRNLDFKFRCMHYIRLVFLYDSGQDIICRHLFHCTCQLKYKHNIPIMSDHSSYGLSTFRTCVSLYTILIHSVKKKYSISFQWTTVANSLCHKSYLKNTFLLILTSITISNTFLKAFTNFK